MSKETAFAAPKVLDLLCARELVAQSNRRIEKATKGIIPALCSTVAFFLGICLYAYSQIYQNPFLESVASIALLGWLGLLIATYVIGGGLGACLKAGGKVALFFWRLIPIFPADVIVAGVGCIFILFGYIAFPVIFLLVIRSRSKKDLKAAEDFILAYEAEAAQANAINQ